MDQVQAMQQQEKLNYKRCDYFSEVSLVDDPGAVDSWCRYKMVEWCYEVVDFIDFSRDTVHIAMSYLDRFLGTGSIRSKEVVRNRKEYQLCAMTCLYIAVKMFEPKMIDTLLLAQLSRGSYLPQEFQRMELEILFELNWHLNDPTPNSFLELFVELLPLSQCKMQIDETTLKEHARYQIELSVVEYDIMLHDPSNIAIAALSNTLNSIFTAHEAAAEGAEMIQELEKIAKADLQKPFMRKICHGMERLHNTKIPVIVRRSCPAPLQQKNTAEVKYGRERLASHGEISPNCTLH
jgi:hypothetical protein|eukprot:scaffold520_cov271-Chaetoceros_neogracile.AAC.10